MRESYYERMEKEVLCWPQLQHLHVTQEPWGAMVQTNAQKELNAERFYYRHAQDVYDTADTQCLTPMNREINV